MLERSDDDKLSFEGKGHLGLGGGGGCKLTVDDPPPLLQSKWGFTLTAAPLAFVSSTTASTTGSGPDGLPRVRMVSLGLPLPTYHRGDQRD